MLKEAQSLLRVESLGAGYGKKEVLHDVSIDVSKGEIVALIGHNGAGKSTLLKAIFGLLPIWRGRVMLEERNVAIPNPRQLLRAGVTYVPQGNRVFADLTVRENLDLGGVTLSDKGYLRDCVEHILLVFPALRSRLGQRAATLSGGEKQMLALATGLIMSPRVLLLDEPSLGLAPQLITEALTRIQDISLNLGAGVLIVEQKVREVLKIAHRVCVLRNGVVRFFGPATTLKDDTKLRELYL